MWISYFFQLWPKVAPVLTCRQVDHWSAVFQISVFVYLCAPNFDRLVRSSLCYYNPSKATFQFSLKPVSRQSLRITSTAPMQLRTMKYHTISCTTTQFARAIWRSVPLCNGCHFFLKYAGTGPFEMGPFPFDCFLTQLGEKTKKRKYWHFQCIW